MSKNIIYEASIDLLNSDLDFSINQLRSLVIKSIDVKVDKGIVYFQFNINSILLINTDSDVSFVLNKSFNEFSDSEKHLFSFIDSFCNELPAKILEEHLDYCFKKMEFTKAPEIKTTFFNIED